MGADCARCKRWATHGSVGRMQAHLASMQWVDPGYERLYTYRVSIMRYAFWKLIFIYFLLLCMCNDAQQKRNNDQNVKYKYATWMQHMTCDLLPMVTDACCSHCKCFAFQTRCALYGICGHCASCSWRRCTEHMHRWTLFILIICITVLSSPQRGSCRGWNKIPWGEPWPATIHYPHPSLVDGQLRVPQTQLKRLKRSSRIFISFLSLINRVHQAIQAYLCLIYYILFLYITSNNKFKFKYFILGSRTIQHQKCAAFRNCDIYVCIKLN